jgi:hypothetical protein
LTVFLAFCPMQAKNNRKIISISKLFTTMKNNLKIWWGGDIISRPLSDSVGQCRTLQCWTVSDSVVGGYTKPFELYELAGKKQESEIPFSMHGLADYLNVFAACGKEARCSRGHLGHSIVNYCTVATSRLNSGQNIPPKKLQK